MKCVVYNTVVVALDGAKKSLDDWINLKTMTFKWKGEKTIHFVQMKLHKTRKEQNISISASSSKAGFLRQMELQKLLIEKKDLETASKTYKHRSTQTV